MHGRPEDDVALVAFGSPAPSPSSGRSAGELRTGRPGTPTSARNSEPASGSSSGAMPSRDVVMNSWSSRGPPKVQAVTWAVGQLDDHVERAVGGVAVHDPAAEQGHPDAALGVDGQAVRVAVVGQLGRTDGGR